ncbi:hypothetical protein C2857_002827 [Epichloe festucae Fl1]|uniref:Uncharacterized protein n=1 Tax=Epichloe festucae (strain Fl1) TaxID=877507 RepID=A0A7S9KNR2_EPIFF|nr:hypothetical protein C2857_002827 [Epichloe festucae Fl1]
MQLITRRTMRWARGGARCGMERKRETDMGGAEGRIMHASYVRTRRANQINVSARPSVPLSPRPFLEQSSTMMTRGTSADEISQHEFRSLLAEYPTVAEAKGAGAAKNKPGQKTLQQLDAYRYDDAIRTFGVEHSPEMTLAHVQTLVEWKLRHGKFRPTLMSLVTSNDAQITRATISSAVTTYRASSGSHDAPQKALDILTKLRGIGPATASLLLNVHDPQRAIFFSDEAYWWLCCGGDRDAIKYSAKEYRALCEKAVALGERLGADMVDVEKAAYVVMRRGVEEGKTTARGKEDGNKGRLDKKKRTRGEDDMGDDKDSPKRNMMAKEHVASGATKLRRSKRRKA